MERNSSRASSFSCRACSQSLAIYLRANSRVAPEGFSWPRAELCSKQQNKSARKLPTNVEPYICRSTEVLEKTTFSGCYFKQPPSVPHSPHRRSVENTAILKAILVAGYILELVTGGGREPGVEPSPRNYACWAVEQRSQETIAIQPAGRPAFSEVRFSLRAMIARATG
ncbi:MAG: hypothetical protein JWQ51_1255 [Tardiphaga sp.]|nr:hypothetical protein [Tardiphaga sp.]